MTSYVQKISPDRFGLQIEYGSKSEEIVKTAANSLIQGKQKGQKLDLLFHITLAQLAKARQELARNLYSPSAKAYAGTNLEKFGQPRTTPYKTTFAGTILKDPPYSAYNEQALTELFISTLQRNEMIDPDHRTIHKTETPVSEDFFLGVREKRRLLILTQEGLMALINSCKEESKDVDPNQLEERKKHADYVSTIVSGVKALRDNNPVIPLIGRRRYLQSDWVIVPRTCEIDRREHTLAYLVSWMYRDYKTSPLERMLQESSVVIIHPDPAGRQPILKEIEKVFVRAMSWNQKELKELKDELALFEYLFSHAMPFERGSSAIQEWCVKAICRAHGLSLSYNSKKYSNLEALTSSLAMFTKNYDSMIELKPLSSTSDISVIEEKKATSS